MSSFSDSKIKRNDWLLADTCLQPIIALYFESETVIKFYNLDAFFSSSLTDICSFPLGRAPMLRRDCAIWHEHSLIACAILTIFVSLNEYPTKAKSHDRIVNEKHGGS